MSIILLMDYQPHLVSFVLILISIALKRLTTNGISVAFNINRIYIDIIALNMLMTNGISVAFNIHRININVNSIDYVNDPWNISSI